MFHHKEIRLPSVNYVGQQFYFITICCFHRRKTFHDPAHCALLLEIPPKQRLLHPLFSIFLLTSFVPSFHYSFTSSSPFLAPNLLKIC